jgi:phosphoesterase RecJ-like protein
MRIPLSRDIATCLLNGLLTDTLGFRTSNTDPSVMETAIELMNAGASLSELTDRVFNHRPMRTIQMWAAAMRDLHLEDHILWTQITQAMRQSTSYWEDGDAGLVNFLNTANEADVAVVFDELPDGRINVSMRAGPGYDVSQVAFVLGGGGHAQAAGCTLDGPSESARARVLGLLHRAWDEQNASR